MAKDSMWTANKTKINDGQTLKFTIDLDSSPISYGEVLRRWKGDFKFRKFFISLLANSPFPEFRWETPMVSAATIDKEFEFVLLNSHGLERKPDAKPFTEYFDTAAQGGVVSFPNLSKSTILIVPCPSDPLFAYSHIGAYSRHGYELQQHALWELVGVTMLYRLDNKPVWLSTAGVGVAWLHIRLDDRPKYYGYLPYKEIV